jgi:hypothetical protein
LPIPVRFEKQTIKPVQRKPSNHHGKKQEPCAKAPACNANQGDEKQNSKKNGYPHPEIENQRRQSTKRTRQPILKPNILGSCHVISIVLPFISPEKKLLSAQDKATIAAILAK